MTSPVFPNYYYYALSCADSKGNTTVVNPPYLDVGSNGFSRTQLVVNSSGTVHNSDPGLLNPWGIAFPANHAAVVANNQSNTSTSYDGSGAAQSPGASTSPLAVQLPVGAGGVPFNPTGIVVAPAGTMVTAGGKSGPAQLIYAGESGMIAAWAPTVDPTNAILVYADSAGAVYKGLVAAGNLLYAADFHNNKIDVFDLTFTKQSGYSFTDPTLPAGYAPHGLYVDSAYHGDGAIYVAYAMQLAPANRDAVAGPGLGIVDVFDLKGNFSTRLITGGALNAPWGMATGCGSPAGNCGSLLDSLLVANTGDGKINGLNFNTGALSPLVDASGAPLAIPGLHGIALGNRYANQPDFTLLYTAGATNAGVYGRIDFGATPRLHAPPDISVTMGPPSSNLSYSVTVDATSTVGTGAVYLYMLPSGELDTDESGLPPFQFQFTCVGLPCGGVSATVTDVDGNIATANATPP
jgi:uncharacterized protein (TIGR03118 family)